MRVLYADDMKELRDLMTIVLSREGYTIETVSDGRLALERIEADPTAFDLVITDHHMHEVNGLEFMKRLRLLPYAGKTAVFSSELGMGVHHAYVQLKVDRILQKPVPPSAVRVLLRELFPSVIPMARSSAAANTPAL